MTLFPRFGRISSAHRLRVVIIAELKSLRQGWMSQLAVEKLGYKRARAHRCWFVGRNRLLYRDGSVSRCYRLRGELLCALPCCSFPWCWWHRGTASPKLARSKAVMRFRYGPGADTLSAVVAAIPAPSTQAYATAGS